MHTFCFENGFRAEVTEEELDLFTGSWQLFSLPVSSRVSFSGTEDGDESVRFLGLSQEGGAQVFRWAAVSPLWKEKAYTLRLYPDHAEYEAAVTGAGAPDRIEYFRGCKGSTGANYFVAGYLVCESAQRDHERSRFFVGEDWTLRPGLSSPPPFVFPFFNDCNDKIVSLGVAAPMGENRYERFSVRFERPRTMWLELPLYGHTKIDGSYRAPVVWIGFGDTDLETVRRYSDWCRARFGYPPAPDPAAAPKWWKKPIFCGWMEQDHLAGESGRTKEMSTQENYERMMARIDRVGLKPGTVIIDDKWQTDYGAPLPDKERWPDMRGFVDRQHKAGRHVLLWWRLWQADGLPTQACMQYRCEAATADPTSPAYRALVEKILHRLLSSEEGCMDCDGLKLDYMSSYWEPEKGAVAFRPDEFGLEMLHSYYRMFYEIAKSIKPDALINSSVMHPYFADTFDQIRLHDYSAVQRGTVSIMRYRAALVRAVFPDALIDTDGANVLTGNNQHILYHNEAAALLGVPALYVLGPLSDDELRQIQKVWDRYEEGL